MADLGSELTRYMNNVICRMAMSCRCSMSENESDEMKELVRDLPYPWREAEHR